MPDSDSDSTSDHEEVTVGGDNVVERHALARTKLFRTVLERVPPASRAALFFETFYNFGSGTFISLFLLSLGAIKTVVPGGSQQHLMLLAVMFGGSSLLSPLVGYLTRWIPLRLMVILPNLITALLLLAIALPIPGATYFTIVVGLCFVLRVFPRVAEMNMYRVLYPATHRGFAVGWLKAIAAISALFITLAGTWWFRTFQQQYWVVYAYAAFTLVVGAFSYSRIPIPQNGSPEPPPVLPVGRTLVASCKMFLSDKRFIRYQIGFAIAGFANHMGMWFIPEVVKEKKYIGGDDFQVLIITAVMPALLIMASSPFWGRYLDKVDPMSGRSLFNLLQTAGYGLYCFGGVSAQAWPMFAGAVCHSISNGGGTINWSTGSLYFAKPENVSLYNSLHVGFTGLRGMIAPVCGGLLVKQCGFGAWMFAVCAGLSLLGSLYMYRLSQTDPGSVELASIDE